MANVDNLDRQHSTPVARTNGLYIGRKDGELSSVSTMEGDIAIVNDLVPWSRYVESKVIENSGVYAACLRRSRNNELEVL